MVTERPTRPRLPRIDAARGVAVVAMVLYHLSWDLNHFSWVALDLFGSPVWLAARAAILSAFLFLAGASLVLSTRRGIDPRRFGRRWALLATAAGAITAVSLAAFPDSPILFGVLHHLTVGSLLGLGFLRLPAPVTALAGVAVLALPHWVGFPVFDSPSLSWVGLVTHDPDANDYVPLFPWFGVLLLGIAAGRLWGETAGGGSAPAPLAWLGRHSLAVYLIHQPVLFGLMWGATAAGLSPAGNEVERSFQSSCVESCAQTGADAAGCMRSCGCIADGLKEHGLWRPVLAQRVKPEEMDRVMAVIRACQP